LPPDEPVELVNVAFEQPKKAGHGQKNNVKNKENGRVNGKGYKDKGKGQGTGRRMEATTEPETPASEMRTTNGTATASPNQGDAGPAARRNATAKATNHATADATPSATPPRTTSAYDVPDRLSGLAAAAELRTACPGRDFRFVAVDIDVPTARAHRQAVVDLMYPNMTGGF
jgi:hypothetical protein